MQVVFIFSIESNFSEVFRSVFVNGGCLQLGVLLCAAVRVGLGRSYIVTGSYKGDIRVLKLTSPITRIDLVWGKSYIAKLTRYV